MPPLPSSAMMRYRPASKRPGRKRPSLIRYSAELEGREDERDDDAEGGRGGVGGSGDVAVAKSMVAMSSVFGMGALPVGAPQAEQKRTLLGKSAPQEIHLAIN